jgi:hypothetical protein
LFVLLAPQQSTAPNNNNKSYNKSTIRYNNLQQTRQIQQPTQQSNGLGVSFAGAGSPLFVFVDTFGWYGYQSLVCKAHVKPH